jgi:hypothetical protein
MSSSSRHSGGGAYSQVPLIDVPELSCLARFQKKKLFRPLRLFHLNSSPPPPTLCFNTSFSTSSPFLVLSPRSQDNLYVGTEDGKIMHYRISGSQDEQSVSVRKVQMKELVTKKKKVEQLEALGFIKRLIALSDGQVCSVCIPLEKSFDFTHSSANRFVNEGHCLRHAYS